MIVNADITLYNRRLDKTTRQYIYKRTVLCGVHWYTDQKVAVSEKGLDSADSIKIRKKGNVLRAIGICKKRRCDRFFHCFKWGCVCKRNLRR